MHGLLEETGEVLLRTRGDQQLWMFTIISVHN